jgi:hypothetical protein
MLTEISKLIDKYYLHEATVYFTDLWLKPLLLTVPGTLTDDLMLWICLSLILNQNEIYN